MTLQPAVTWPKKGLMLNKTNFVSNFSIFMEIRKK